LTDINTKKIKRIDHQTKTIYFEPDVIKKVTGSRLSSILGRSSYDTPFKVACDMAKIYSEYESSIYTEAGNTLEPVMRSYLRSNADELLRSELGLLPEDIIGVEEPISSVVCNYDHFKDVEIFGGMVDGYVVVNGKRAAVLEIKTSSREQDWVNLTTGTRTAIPEGYLLQTGLYSKLSGLKKVVFVAGFLRKNHYDDPHTWSPNKNNCSVIVIDAPDVSKEMDEAKEWYHQHILNGVTPQWTERDEDIVCGIQEEFQPLEPSVQDLMEQYAQLEDETSKYSEALKEISLIEKKKDSIKKILKPKLISMLEPGQDVITCSIEGFVFKLTNDTKNVIDEDKMKAEGVYDKYLVEKPSARLNVNRKASGTQEEVEQ